MLERAADSPWLPAFLWIAVCAIGAFMEAWFREDEA